MTTQPRPPRARAWAAARGMLGAFVIAVLVYTFFLGRVSNGLRVFDYFGYFTNLTSLLFGVTILTLGAPSLVGRSQPRWIIAARAILTTCMIVVGVIYNTLVPGTGSAPFWVSVTLHVIVPIFAVADWTLSTDRPAMPWSRLWIVLPYPALWLVVVLVRGATDGWVPYGFLLPERGMPSLLLHIAGLFLFLGVAGTAVWMASRLPPPSPSPLGLDRSKTHVKRAHNVRI